MFPSPDQIPELTVSGSGKTDKGKKRKLNEDRLAVRDDLHLYLVCDGAGGHNAGDVAAALAVRSITNYMGATVRSAFERPEFDRFGIPNGARRVSAAVHKANNDIIEISRTSHQHRGMGTTVVAVSFTPRSGLIHIAHVGDSRCYRMRAGHLELITQDHSLLTDVVENRPELDDTMLERLPRNIITRALGVDPELRVSVRSYAVVAGDRYVLCSDGLYAPLPASTIASVLQGEANSDAAAQKLVDAANDAGGPDNIAAVVVDCASGPSIALPSGFSAPPPSPSEHYTPDPELLILGVEDIDLDDTASDELLNSLGAIFKGKT
ncbi:MAG TPA: protein phosphatase 2C domain-containing protein [Polyangiaceae bacterium]|nr:protein phosphatase 2C domain-containing protein [Polyangiaceae bacterium]